MRTFLGAALTPHQIGKVLTRSFGTAANAWTSSPALGVGTAGH